MGVSSSESYDLTAFYEMLTASFGVLSQNTGFYPSLDRIVETMLGPLNLGPGGGSCNKPISHLHHTALETPTPTPNNPDTELKPNMAVGRCKAILRKDFKKDPQINMIFEEICSEFYLLAVTEHIFIESGDYKKQNLQLAHHTFQQLNCEPFEISHQFAVTGCM